MSTTAYAPPAVPLPLCLKSLFDSQGNTSFELDAAVKILQTIVDNNGAEKFRSLNATKVLPRIAPNTLELWYVLRHAGFHKVADRLICPSEIPLSQTRGVLEQLITTIHQNKTLRENLLTTPKSPQAQHETATTMMEDDAQQPTPTAPSSTMNDSTTEQQLETPQQEMVEAPTIPASTSSPVSTTSTDSKKSTALGGNVNLKAMTVEERRAYVAEQMKKKKAGAQ